MLPCRLIIDPPQSGVWNMSVDEVLLDSAINEGVTTLRFYQWEEPTLSLGYFQKLAERDNHAASRNCPVVRRHSGGGAILHDREITYSLSLPPKCDLVREPELIYRRTHEALLAAFADFFPSKTDLLPTANLCSAAIPPAGETEPFLCFQRRARCDVLLPAKTTAETIDGRHKIAGSAQRKRRGGVLQHGSLLLQSSSAAPELPGLCELTDHDAGAEELIKSWAGHISANLDLNLSPSELTTAETERANQLAEAQFGADAWIARR